MRAVETVTWTGAVLLTLFFMSAPCWAADNPDGYYIKHEHQFAQDVSGDGFAMVHQVVNTKTLQLKNYMHGSGSMDMATLINSSQKSESYKYFDKTKWGDEKFKSGNITFLEQNEMSYAPRSFAYGTGYYERNPVVYNSKLKEKTCGKNYQDDVGTSMHHQIEYAQGFIKDIAVNLDCKAATKDAKGAGLIEMRIDEEVTEGVVHVGELMTDMNTSGKNWKKPLIEIDENYVGSFKIKKNMKVIAEKSKKSDKKDWLSCCFGGYGGIDDENKTWGEEEIFDCTCRQVAWDGSGWSNLTQEQYTPDKVKVSLEGEPVVEEPEPTVEELLEMLREKGYEGNVTIDSNETASGNTTLV